MRARAVVAALLLTLGGASAALAVTDSAPGPIAVAAHEVLAARAVTASWVPGSPEVQDDWERDDWDWVDQAPPAEESLERSARKAVFLSALLPGLGERYVGRHGRARIFHVAEGLIWSTFAYYRVQARIRRDTQIEFAQVNGGAPSGQDEDYYEHIGFWLSLEEWHDIVRRDARRRFPDDAAAQEEFFQSNQRYSGGQFWEWEDDSERLRYRQLRSRAERSYRNARLAAGAAIFNRLASMVDALAVTRSHNRSVREAEQARMDWRIGPFEAGEELVVGPVLTRTY